MHCLRTKGDGDQLISDTGVDSLACLDWTSEANLADVTVLKFQLEFQARDNLLLIMLYEYLHLYRYVLHATLASSQKYNFTVHLTGQVEVKVLALTKGSPQSSP